MSAQIKKFETPAAAAEACGAAIFDLLTAARQQRGTATVAFSGGSTPKIMFEWMTRQAFDWTNIDIFQVDERCVPIDDSQSNFRMMREALLSKAGIAPERIHRVRTELIPDEAATEYAAEIAQTLRLTEGDLPVFDVIQRGMGPDAHTASLFPGEPLIENRTGIAAAVWVEKFHQFRVTLLPAVLESARHTVCLVTGADKSAALRQVFKGPRSPMESPSQISSPEMLWFVDNAAVADL
jgi:6-phosphogluconolactonase